MVQVAVVGSANIDFVTSVDRLPAEGETVMGGDYVLHPGGKGANQAVAAARMGADVAFVGVVGADEPGELLFESLRDNGVGLDGFRRVDHTPTGAAFITVDRRGRNQIVVSPGANNCVDRSLIKASQSVLGSAEVLLVQMEIPDEGVMSAVQSAGGTVLLNPAPARALSEDLLGLVDVLIPNETELGIIAGGETPSGLSETIDMARSIRGPGIIITTLGSQGAVICSGSDVIEVPSLIVKSIDSTGAGDTFCGVFAAGLTFGMDVESAALGATKAAAISVTRPGAQSSMPTQADMAEFSG